jgi:hypothetical protein
MLNVSTCIFLHQQHQHLALCGSTRPPENTSSQWDTHTHIHTRTQTLTYTHTHTRTQTHLNKTANTHTQTRTQNHTHTSTHTHTWLMAALTCVIRDQVRQQTAKSLERSPIADVCAIEIANQWMHSHTLSQNKKCMVNSSIVFCLFISCCFFLKSDLCIRHVILLYSSSYVILP